VTTFVILASIDDGNPIFSPVKALHQLGYFPIGFAETAKAVALTAILFLGPLFEAGIAEGQWRDWIRLRGLDAVIHGWIGYRNMVAVRASSPHSSHGGSS
jgi:prenyl protein peptidase